MTVALITGASSGIGEAFARRLAADGRDLVLAARSGEKLEKLCGELSKDHRISAAPFAVDLAAADADRAVFEFTQEKGFAVDLLINNAGFGSMGDFSQLDAAGELRMIDLNIRALVGLTHHFLPQMRQRRRGTIINVSSAAGFQPIPFMATYAATKTFVTTFSEAVAEENRPYGVRIMALCPGSTKTNFFNASQIDRDRHIKGQQTAEEVVETAMKAMAAGRTKVISGWTNYIGALMATYAPNALTTRMIARTLRSKYQKDLER